MLRKRKALSKHDKAEIFSGLSYLVIYAGALYHVLQSGDYVSSILMTVGTIGAIFYGILHLKAKTGKKGES